MCITDWIKTNLPPFSKLTKQFQVANTRGHLYVTAPPPPRPVAPQCVISKVTLMAIITGRNV
jgi:hypothetical protein